MSFLKELAGHPEYRKLLKAAEDMKPQLPYWQIDANNGKDNTDEWKRKSAMLEGYELCLQIFSPR